MRETRCKGSDFFFWGGGGGGGGESYFLCIDFPC